jgi:hypothetical protein
MQTQTQTQPEWDEEIIYGDTTDTALTVSALPTFLPPDQVPDLDAMREGTTIAPKYWEVENVGESKRGIFIGWSQLQSQQGGKIPMAVLQNRREIFTSAAVNLTQQLQMVPVGTAVSITYTGKEKTNSGFYVKKFDVRLLKQDGSAEPTIPTPPAPVVDVGNLGRGIEIPSKRNGANGVKPAVIKTPRFAELVAYLVNAGHADEKSAPFKVTHIAANAGFAEITNDNLDTVLHALEEHYAAK